MLKLPFDDISPETNKLLLQLISGTVNIPLQLISPSTSKSAVTELWLEPIFTLPALLTDKREILDVLSLISL